MKKILGLAAGFLLTIATYAQVGVTFTDANESYDKAKTTSFNFEFSSAFTADEINKAASYYTGYFTVATVASAVGNNVTITLVEDNEMSRRVITRFFMTLNVDKISVNGEPRELQDFIAEFIMV